MVVAEVYAPQFTRLPPFFAARAREGAPRSPCAVVLAGPHPKPAAQDRSDTVERRRAPLPWRACDGTRQVTCASLRAVHLSLASRLGRNTRLQQPTGPAPVCGIPMPLGYGLPL